MKQPIPCEKCKASEVLPDGEISCARLGGALEKSPAGALVAWPACRYLQAAAGRLPLDKLIALETRDYRRRLPAAIRKKLEEMMPRVEVPPCPPL